MLFKIVISLSSTRLLSMKLRCLLLFVRLFILNWMTRIRVYCMCVVLFMYRRRLPPSEHHQDALAERMQHRHAFGPYAGYTFHDEISVAHA